MKFHFCSVFELFVERTSVCFAVSSVTKLRKLGSVEKVRLSAVWGGLILKLRTVWQK